jgi:Family of unknown function (DUF6113)
MSQRGRAAGPATDRLAVARPEPPARPHAGLLALGYLVFTVAGALTAAIEVLLVPSRIGQTLVPLAPALAVLSNLALPALSRGLTDTRASAVPPYAGWLATTLVLAGARPEGDVLLPAGDAAYISYSLLGLGTLAGAVAVWRAGRPTRWTGLGPGLGSRLSSARGRAGSGSDGAR